MPMGGIDPRSDGNPLHFSQSSCRTVIFALQPSPLLFTRQYSKLAL